MIRKLVVLAQAVKEAYENYQAVEKEFGSNSLASNEAFKNYEDKEHELLNFVLTQDICAFEITKSYWKMVVEDELNANSDFEEVIELTEQEENEIVNRILDIDDLWCEVSNFVYGKISEVLAKRKE